MSMRSSVKNMPIHKNGSIIAYPAIPNNNSLKNPAPEVHPISVRICSHELPRYRAHDKALKLAKNATRTWENRYVDTTYAISALKVS